MGEAIAFYVISAFILGFAVLVVSTKNTVHAVLFLVLNFLAVAALYVLLTAQFLAVIQVLVYAGGIVVLYLFVVMLVNLKRPPEDHSAPQRRGWLGFALSGVVLAQLAAILVWGGPFNWAIPAREWIIALLWGGGIGLGTLALFAAYRHGNASVVTALTGLYPAVTAVLAMVIPFFGEGFTSVKIGAIELHNVEGMVIEQGLGVALLGMSFLNRVEMKRDGHAMTLTRLF